MVCPDCGVEVAEDQKFCHDCGATLALPVAPAVDPATTEQPDTEPIDIADQPTLDQPTLDQPDTEPIDITDQPTLDQPTLDQPTLDQPTLDQPDTEPIDLTPPTPTIDVFERPPMPAPISAPADEATTEMAVDTTTGSTTDASSTAEMPALFDGSEDLVEYHDPPEPFRIRVVFILSIFATVAVLMTIVADIIDIRTTRPAAGIATGARTLDDLGTNLGLAAFVGAAVMVLGALLACFGLRWGAGLAGGSGLALAGWAGLTIGLAELPIAIAESITRTSTSPEPFTLRVTRDVGWWLIAAVGLLGVLVFLSSLRSIGTGGKRALNPLIAALTAVAAVILGFGPLVPVGDASFADNFRSTDPSRDLPTAFFVGRLGQVALIAAIGAVGMLLVRAYGLGLAAGAVTTATAMWVTSLVELGDRPIGIADRNPGAATTVPHGVTTVGMVATLALLAIAAALATYRLNRRV